MSESDCSLIGVVLVIAACSIAGVWSSFASNTVTSHPLGVECLSGLSAGVLFGVAWLHLLDDAQERLEGQFASGRTDTTVFQTHTHTWAVPCPFRCALAHLEEPSDRRVVGCLGCLGRFVCPGKSKKSEVCGNRWR